MTDPAIFTEATEVYLARRGVQALPHPVFEDMQALANRKVFPIVGPEAGRFFLQLARLKRPRRVLELGSGFGYSAIWFALACEHTRVVCTEFNAENIAMGQDFAAQAGVAGRIEWHEGDALDYARSLGQPEPFDVVFCDIDKADYPRAWRLCREKLTGPGSLILFDNILWSGRVALSAGKQDEATRAVVETTDLAYADEGVDVSIVPIRDGILTAMTRE
ncbi:MAG: O-methyltransferase [Sumerlaeia bacterium]